MGSKQEYFNSNRLIPFTTHDDFMKLEKKYIEALAFITYISSSTDFETISELGGFEGGYSEIIDNNFYSYKLKKRSEIGIKTCAEYFNKHRNTISNYLNYLEYIADYSNYLYVNEVGAELFKIDYIDNECIYKLNHKAFDNKFYVTIDINTLYRLMQINGTAIKLYLVIKYHYEACKKKGKLCELDMDYLSDKIGLSNRSQVSKVLDKMDNVFIKRKIKTKTIVKGLNKISKSIYQYEII